MKSLSAKRFDPMKEGLVWQTVKQRERRPKIGLNNPDLTLLIQPQVQSYFSQAGIYTSQARGNGQ